jgi:hypothetical protein
MVGGGGGGKPRVGEMTQALLIIRNVNVNVNVNVNRL